MTKTLDESGAPAPTLQIHRTQHWLRHTLSWMKQLGIVYDVGSGSFMQGRRNFSVKELARFAKTDVAFGSSQMSADMALTVVKTIAYEKRTGAIQELSDRLLGAPRCDDGELRRFLAALLVTETGEEFENCVVVVKHWMWLVGRSILGLPNTWHMMPIFWGGQGGGKSTQIRRLLGPLGHFWRPSTFQVFIGQFDAMPLHWNFVLFLDEMAAASKAEAQRIKYVMDATNVPGRNMHDDGGRNIAKNANFIAATNDPPPHGLSDSTGNRRFYSLECKSDKVEGARKELFDSINYLKIWQCADPQSEAPLLERQSVIAARQEEMRPESILETFIPMFLDNWDGEKTKLAYFQQQLVEYARSMGHGGYRAPSQKELVAHLLTQNVSVVNHKNVLYIRPLI